MTARRRSAAGSLASKSVELALAAPQVVAKRLAMLSTVGPYPSLRDQREILGMGTEKIAAFQQSLVAMWFQIARAQTAAFHRLFLAMTTSPMISAASAQRSTHLATVALTKIMVAGITPIHRKTVSNAARLTRKRR